MGRGRVLLLTTTVDREWTDLPIRPGFLPLIQEAARYLAGAPSGEAATAIAVGQKREIALDPDDRRVEIVQPAGESRWLTPPARSGDAHARRTLTFGETDEPGFYRVRAARSDGDDRRASRRRVRGQPRPARVRPGASRRRQAPRPRHGVADGRRGRPRRRLELWHALGAAAIALVLLESLLTLRFRRGRVKAMNKSFGNDDVAGRGVALADVRAGGRGPDRDPRPQRRRRPARHPGRGARRAPPGGAGPRGRCPPGRRDRHARRLLGRLDPARAGRDGELDTIDSEPHHAEVARESFRRAGFAGRARVHVGRAAGRVAQAGGARSV